MKSTKKRPNFRPKKGRPRESIILLQNKCTDRPQRMAYAPMNGPPINSRETLAESKNLLIDVLDTYRKVICPFYNHDPKTNGWGGILRSMI